MMGDFWDAPLTKPDEREVEGVDDEVRFWRKSGVL